MALVAQRKLPIGEFAFGPGDHIDATAQAALPPGRLEALKRAGYVVETPTELPDNEMAARLVALETRVTRLEAAGRRPAARKRGAA